MKTFLVVSLVVLGGCASSPPQPVQVVPVSEAPMPPTTSAEPATPAETPTAATEETAAAPTPECQAPEECVKARGEAAAGSQWICEAGTCVAQAAAEPPKTDEAASSGKPAKAKKPAKTKKKKDGVGE
jgi:hypothetical protein